jgi:hypothetical protein
MPFLEGGGQPCFDGIGRLLLFFCGSACSTKEFFYALSRWSWFVDAVAVIGWFGCLLWVGLDIGLPKATSIFCGLWGGRSGDDSQERSLAATDYRVWSD